jgi:hypothetical protein
VYGEEERCIQVGKGKVNITWQTEDKWEDNIKLELQKVGWEGMSYVDLARNRHRLLADAILTAKKLLASEEGICLLELVKINCYRSCLYR